MTGLLGRLLGVLLLASFTAPSPAHADEAIGLSWDGKNWSSELAGSLFDPAVRWVPGDVRTAAFHVRNQADGGATVSIAVDSADRDRLLRNEDIAVQARGAGAGWVDLDDTTTGVLPNTGAPQVGWLIVVAGLMLGVGLALLRRREEEADGTPR